MTRKRNGRPNDNKNKRPRVGVQKSHDDRVIELKNDTLEEFYKQILTPDDYADAFKAFRTSLPASVRINKSVPLWRATLQTIINLSSSAQAPGIEGKENEISPSSKCLISADWELKKEKFEASGAGCQKKGLNESQSGAIVPWFPSGLVWQWDSLNRVAIKKNPVFRELKAFLVAEDIRGAVIRQEAASMIPPLFMDLHYDHLVLDMCAAPGSKTSQIIDLLARSSKLYETHRESKGGVIANEIDLKRAAMLSHQLSRLGSPLASVMCSDAAVFPLIVQKDKTFIQFDRILADVPCSGDGTLRKQPDIWKSWTISGAMSLHIKQIAILKRGLKLLKVGGRLVYSTCSLNPIENEAVVSSILQLYNQSIALSIPTEIPLLNHAPGLSSWKVANPKRLENDTNLTFYDSYEEVPEDVRSVIRPTMFPPKDKLTPLTRCIRILPHHNNTSGFFVAIFIKHSELNLKETRKAKSVPNKERKILDSKLKNDNENAESTVSDEIISEVSISDSNTLKRSSQPKTTGAHAHPFTRIDINSQDIQRIKTFFGFTTALSLDKHKWSMSPSDPICCVPIPSDNFDMRWTINYSLTITNPTTTTPTNDNELILTKLQQEPEDFLQECRTVWGPRDVETDFELEQLVHREHSDKRLYLISKAMQTLLDKSDDSSQLNWVNLGVRVLEKLDAKQSERFEGCDWRLTQDGVMAMIPYLRKRIIFVNLSVAKLLITSDRSLSGNEMLHAERNGLICNLNSCRNNQSERFSKFIPGSLVAVIVPPRVIPIEGLFPNKTSDTREMTDDTTKTKKFSTQEKNSNSESPICSFQQKQTTTTTLRNFEKDFCKTSSTFLFGTFKESVPISCILTKSGTLIPYIKKEEAMGIEEMPRRPRQLKLKKKSDEVVDDAVTVLKELEPIKKTKKTRKVEDAESLRTPTSKESKSTRPLLGGNYEITKSDERGIVYISHLPSGFLEPQLQKFLSQFGEITRFRLLRSKKTGGSKGYAFAEFSFKEVAEVVVNTMNGYLIFGKTLKCKLLTPEEVPASLFTKYVKYPKRGFNVEKQRRQINTRELDLRGADLTEARATIMLKKERLRLKSLKSLNIDFSPASLLR